MMTLVSYTQVDLVIRIRQFYTYNNGYITVTTTTLPKDLRPYLPWKLVIKDVSTGLTAETTGILRINVPDEKQEDVKILQIMPDIDSKHDYSLKLNDSDFMKLFNGCKVAQLD